MKTTLFAIIICLSACGATQDLSASEQQFDELNAAMADAENCGRQNSECRHSDAGHRECNDDMRVCIAACRPWHRSPDLDALHACNETYSACAGDDDDWDDDDVVLDGGTPVDCETEHRACLCTVFTDAWNDFCANVALRCENETSRTCTRLTARCADPMTPRHGVCD